VTQGYLGITWNTAGSSDRAVSKGLMVSWEIKINASGSGIRGAQGSKIQVQTNISPKLLNLTFFLSKNLKMI
jgi:hypothetical protein